MSEPLPSAEKDVPVCRTCHAAMLTADQLERFNAEPVTTCIYLCPEHQAAHDRIFGAFADLVIADAKLRGYDFPTDVLPPEVTP